MKAILKWTAVVIGVLMVVAAAALVLVPAFIDVKRYKAPLERYLTEITGRPVEVAGDIGLSLFPWTGLTAAGLRLGNPPQFAEKDFLTVESFDVSLNLLPLLFKEIEIDRLVVKKPRLFMVTNQDGRASWQFGTKPAPPRSQAPEPAPPLETSIKSLLMGELSIQNGQLVLIDHRRATRREVSDLNLAVRDVSLDRPIHLAFSAEFNQKPISAEGRIGPVREALGSGAVPLEMKATAFGQLKLQVQGTVENVYAAPQANVRVEVAEFSPRKLAPEIGLALPSISDPKALDRLALKAAVQADSRVVIVSEGVIALDDSHLSLSLKATEFSRPHLVFDLTLDQIDADRYLPAKNRSAAGAPVTGSSTQSPPERADYQALRNLFLDGNAAVGQLTVYQAKMEGVRFKVSARDGLISIDPFDMKLYQGTAVGKIAVNLAGDRPVTEVQLAVDQVHVNPLLEDVVNQDFLAGVAKAHLTLSMNGDDPAQLKQTLEGQGDLHFNDGAIIGVDLAGMVRNVKSAFSGEAKAVSKPRTDFSELTVPFTLQNGVFNTSEASLKSPLLRLAAVGKADLSKETLDFRVEPKLVGTIKGQGDTRARSGLGVPILVSGSFSRPVFQPDLEGIAKDQLRKALGPQKPGDVLKGILPGKN